MSGDVLPKDYFFVTDLVNPVYAYWERNVKVPTPFSTQKKLSYGKRIHRISRYWFEKLPGFQFSEASLAGGYVGIDNVSGRIDYFIENSVIEFKTKDTPIPDKNYVLTTFPQDLEQLLIYSAMLYNPSDTHYLIFTEEHGNIAERIFRAFKVTINNHEAIKNFTIRRRDDLYQALRSNDPSQLPKCRYFDTGCKFKEKKACNCDNLSPLDAQKTTEVHKYNRRPNTKFKTPEHP
jgi:hypothetical protein